MFGSFPQPRFLPCTECGASVPRKDADGHVCEHERWLDYQLFQLRDEIGSFEGQLGHYLDSAQGRFDLWLAEQDRAGDG